MSTRKIRNYDVLSNYLYFIPNPIEMFSLLLFLLAGALFGNAVVLCLMLIPGMSMSSDLTTLVAYPIMFIPPMIYASVRSQRNMMFDDGRSMDSSEHFGKSGLLLAVMVMLATVSMSFLMDIINSQMPPMPEWLESALKGMTQGNVIINFICVSLMAPFFEEWLCRGMVLRGLLNYRRRPGADGTPRNGMKPVWAIVISAAFFALIHMNPWQAVPAFGLGCLFGYVYYRTGSLKLTMLMHFTNNTIALIAGNIDSLKDADTWLDIMPVWAYCVIAVVFLAYLYIFTKRLNEIPLNSPQGNCDVVSFSKR